MAQSPIGASSGLGTAREPSMEEILASIRRIIEESDTGQPDAAPPLAVNSDVPAQTASKERYEDTLDSEEAELAPRQGIAVAPPVQKMPEPAFSRALPEVESKPVEAAVGPSPEQEAVITTAQAPVEELLSAETAKQPAAEPSLAAPQPIAYAGFNEQKSEPEAKATLPEPEPIVIEEFETSMEEEVSLDLAQALEPILSESTERQVSAAFEDLSFAVRSEQRRSFDEIAQEIMRPLLQDWLDNNLPNLVERLVREEIERVARGGKR
ncbi:DUF2497 domain-containing protein [Phyllobacterium sp. SB3]|uniref:PopZ family protein n=1 Tax=Phyllobacterium sp. SB3 TaxID=3156073 RepID=UPI0032AF0B82